MLGVYADAERVFEALRAGAVGYLLKNTPLAQLKEHLLQVAGGGSPMSPGVARFVVQAFQRQPAARPALPAAAAGLPPEEPLTARELEIVRGIEDGLSYQLIADRHFISLDTVRNHIRSVYRKLPGQSQGRAHGPRPEAAARLAHPAALSLKYDMFMSYRHINMKPCFVAGESYPYPPELAIA